MENAQPNGGSQPNPPPTDPISLEDQETPPAPQPTGNVTPPLGLPVAAIRQLAALGGGLARTHFHITHGQCSDIGLVRSNNEDAILSFLATQVAAGGLAHFGLFIVADGAGGHDDGEEAASTAVRVTAEQINRRIYLPLLDTAATLGADSPPLLESLSEAVRAANRAVMQDVPGAGTTLTAALLMGDTVYLAHVGDSRAYLLTPHTDTGQYEIECLTRDHSVARRLEETGQITAEEATHHPEKNRLWKILGRDAGMDPDTGARPLVADSYLLLCSDGLWGMVPESDIAPVILTSATPQEACDRLVALANMNGGPDNISAIVLHITG